MTTALAVMKEPESSRGAAQWTALRNLGEAVQLAEWMAKSNAFPDIGNAGKALVKILAGAELGFGAFASLVDVHMIEGKPVIGAHLRAAAIKGSDKYDYEIREHTDEVCDVEFFEFVGSGKVLRKGCAGWKSLGNMRYTIQEAHAKGWHLTGSGKVKSPWAKSPRNMLFARLISDGYKFHCPDITGGVLTYDPDELDQRDSIQQQPAIVQIPLKPAEPGDVIDAEYQVEPTSPADKPTPTITGEQVDRLDVLFTELTLAKKAIADSLAKRGVAKVSELTTEQAAEMITALEQRLEKKRAAVPTT